MYAILLAYITAFVLTYLAIPSIIRVAVEKGLYDKPNDRSAHRTPTPSLGGIGIFAGMVCAIVLWTPLGYFGELQYILAAFVIIFLTGIQDDLLPLSPNKKLLGQLLSAVILVVWSHLKITSFYGVFNIYILPPFPSFLLSLVLIMGIVNSFNLIDGINGLAGAVGLLACGSLGFWFHMAGYPELAVVAFSLAGSLSAFLRYNFLKNARIFMGDTGSLLVGTVCAILTVKFVELNGGPALLGDFSFHAAPAIAVGVLFLPLFDTFRVFTRRLMERRSPFSPDRKHVHHILIDFGLSHLQATSALITLNILLLVFLVTMNHLGNATLLLIELGVAAAFSYLLYKMEERIKRKKRKRAA